MTSFKLPYRRNTISLSKEELAKIVDSHTSIESFLKELGYNNYANNWIPVRSLLNRLNIDYYHLYKDKYFALRQKKKNIVEQEYDCPLYDRD